jgi:hypothetical protein
VRTGCNTRRWGWLEETSMLLLLMGGIYGGYHSNGLRWHDICRFRHWHNIKVIASTIWEAAMLVLLKWGTHEIWRWDGLTLLNIHTKFHDDWFRRSSNNKLMTATIWEAVILVLLMRRIYVIYFELFSCGMIYVPSFMKMSRGIQANITVLPHQF